MTLRVRPDDIAVATDRPRASYRTDLVSVLLSTWVLVGLLLDAWAHNNIPELESFFTPWHAVLYSGFAANAAWIAGIVYRHVRAGRRGLAAIPVGYGLGVLGVPMFAAAGVGDLLWHTVFGIEQELKILFSPTHLVLAVSMILIATSPLRSMWSGVDAPSLRGLLPAVLSVALVGTGLLVFLQYANAFIWSPAAIVSALSTDLHHGGGDPVGLVTSIAVTNVVLLGPLLMLGRRWPVPPGAATIYFVLVAGLCAAVTEFRSPAVLLGVVAAGIGADALAGWLRPAPTRRNPYLAFAALVPLVTWSVYLVAATLGAGTGPTIVEFWTGIPVVAAVHGLLLGTLSAPVAGR